MNRLQLKHTLWVAPLFLSTLAGCTRDYKFQPIDMWNGSRLKPYEQINFFEDNNSSRTPPSGSVARGQARTDEPLYYGTQSGKFTAANPVLTNLTPQQKLAVLQRGQERYNIYCQPCHGLSGSGDGMIVKRGLAAPPTYHQERLRKVEDGYLFDVITNGYGSMYSYASRVPTRDRWAIVAYIRTLQRSQNAKASDVAKLPPVGTRQVEPPLRGELDYIGPSAGREYHGAGAGNEAQQNGREVEQDKVAH